MHVGRLRGFFLPSSRGRNASSRDHSQFLNQSGMRLLGAAEVMLSLSVFLAQAIATNVMPSSGTATFPAWQTVIGVLVGLLTLGVGTTNLGRESPIFLTCLSAWLSCAVVLAGWLASDPSTSNAYVSLHITAILLTTLAVAALRPVEFWVCGSAIWLSYLGAYIAGAKAVRDLTARDLSAWDPSQLIFLAFLVIACALLAGILTARRSADFRMKERASQTAQSLSGAHLRAMLAENAVSVGKLAAALTHEMNTPLGVLKSSVDTMLVLAAKQCNADPEDQQRLVTMQADLRGSVNNSLDRLQQVIGRLQRFVDLDDYERQPADLNELLENAAILLKSSLKQEIKVEFDLQPVPPLTCRAQQITSVFSTLLSNAANAVNGDGRIVISTRKVNSKIRVRVEDNGHGMEESELEKIFEPGFKVTAGRVSTGNWSLFSSRQIVFEHGGDILISSQRGKGTRVDVVLPIHLPHAN